jgi:hypothetical protein
MKRVLPVTVIAAAALLSSTGDAAGVGSPQTVVGDGGCIVCPFFDYGDYGTLSLSQPVNRCTSVFGGSQGLACSGWSYWDRTRVWKASGGSIRVGFWYLPAGGLPTMAYRMYNDPWNGGVVTVDRTEVGAPWYVASTCAYDYVYGGAPSSVYCEAIDW